jgi:aspartate kinase
VVPAARRQPVVTYEEMLELAAAGAKVLHLRCVEYARRYDVPIHVRSSFSTRTGTWVVADLSSLPPIAAESVAASTNGDTPVEQPIIAGVALDLGDAKITVVGVPDRPGEAAEIFQAVADANVNIDMIVQNVSIAASGRTDVTFTCPTADAKTALDALTRQQPTIGFESLQYDEDIAKISLIGAGMRSHPGVSATFFRAIADAGINVEMITTSEIRISVVTRTDVAQDAVRVVHTAFGLDVEGEAVVYGGTGR